MLLVPVNRTTGRQVGQLAPAVHLETAMDAFITTLDAVKNMVHIESFFSLLLKYSAFSRILKISYQAWNVNVF